MKLGQMEAVTELPQISFMHYGSLSDFERLVPLAARVRTPFSARTEH